ncbi:hypothetical protein ACWEPN_04685 [Nonomuraea wenchangensis]
MRRGAAHELVDRISAFKTGYLALLELRLESTRRPELRAVLLYLALNWLIVERLTLPEIFTEQEVRELVDTAVRRALNA